MGQLYNHKYIISYLCVCVCVCMYVWHFWPELWHLHILKFFDSKGFGREKLKECSILPHSLGTLQYFKMSFRVFDIALVACEIVLMWLSAIKNSIFNRWELFDVYSSAIQEKRPSLCWREMRYEGFSLRSWKRQRRMNNHNLFPLANSMIWLCLHIRLAFVDLWASVHVYQIADSTTSAWLVIERFHTAQ